jgi:hypothetical protein
VVESRPVFFSVENCFKELSCAGFPVSESGFRFYFLSVCVKPSRQVGAAVYGVKLGSLSGPTTVQVCETRLVGQSTKKMTEFSWAISFTGVQIFMEREVDCEPDKGKKCVSLHG